MIKNKILSPACAALFAATSLVGGGAEASSLTFQSGAGQSVSASDADLQTTFAGIGYGQSLLNYQTNGISVTVDDQNVHTLGGFFFNGLNTTQGDGFVYGNNGNNSFFTVAAVSGADMYGIEFQYGNGVGEDTLNLEWVALNNGVIVDSGIQSNAQRGLFYGLSGSMAFDEVRLSAYRTNARVAFPQQFLAMDNLRIDLDGPPVSQVPLPAGAVFLLSALGGLVLSRKKRAA